MRVSCRGRRERVVEKGQSESKKVYVERVSEREKGRGKPGSRGKVKDERNMTTLSEREEGEKEVETVLYPSGDEAIAIPSRWG